jgi:hypothetical protein
VIPAKALRGALKGRLARLRGLAEAQKPVQAKVFEAYQKEGLAAEPVGANTLPVAAVEVTRNTLPALASQPEVVAVLPNQRIHLIRPREVEYASLRQQEVSSIAIGNLLYIPGATKFINIFYQQYFHFFEPFLSYRIWSEGYNTPGAHFTRGEQEWEG